MNDAQILKKMCDFSHWLIFLLPKNVIYQKYSEISTHAKKWKKYLFGKYLYRIGDIFKGRQ